MQSWCPELWRRNAEFYGSKVAVIDGDKRLTWAEINERVNRLYWVLRNRGVAKGDRVAVLAPNCAEFLECRGACEKGGYVGVPISWRAPAETIKYIVNHSEAGVLVVHQKFCDLVTGIRSELPSVKHVLTLGEPQDVSLGEPYEEALSEASPEEPDALPEDDDLVYLIYSSGTTGLPKGIMYHHRMQLESSKLHIMDLGLRSTDVTYSVLPWFHSGGHAISSATCYVGATQIAVERFEVEQFLRVAARERVTLAHVVPTMIAMILEHPALDRFDLSSLRTFSYVGASMPLGLLQKAMQKFGRDRFIQMYGLTENGPIVSCLSREDHIRAVTDGATEAERRRLGSIGVPDCTVRVRIVDEYGNLLPPGEAGEIAVRSENTMKGYWKQPELTQQKLRDGWLLTGDVGKLDEDGYLYLLDRKDDMIVTGGENVYPSHVEQVLCLHPAVKEAAVVGVPDEKWGERVVAAVAFWPGGTATEEELIEFCKGKLAGYERPKSIVILPELPKSGSGKIMRKDVRNHLRQVLAGSAG